MARVNRYDVGTLAPAVELDSGWLRAEAKISRCGIQDYQNADGSLRRELRLPEEVFAPASIDAMAMIPLTLNHPPMLLDSMTAKGAIVGSIGTARQLDDDWIAAPLLIIDRAAIEAVKSGLNAECSVGYSCSMDDTPGIHPKWGAYDSIQREIRPNHLALVAAARAGHEARVRLDASGNAVLASAHSPQPSETPPMKIAIGTLHLDATDANAPAIQSAIESAISAEKQRADSAVTARALVDKAIANIRTNLAKRGARKDAVKARAMECDECAGSGKVMDGMVEKKCDYCDGAGSFRMHDAIKAGMVDPGMDDPDADEDMDADELATEQATESEAQSAAKKDAREKKIATAVKRRADSIARRIDRAVKSRVALEVEARGILGSDAKLDGLDDLAIRKQVIAKLAPAAKIDDRDVPTAYRLELARISAKPAPVDAVRAGIRSVPAPRGDASIAAVDAARADFATSRSDAWKPQPVSK